MKKPSNAWKMKGSVVQSGEHLGFPTLREIRQREARKASAPGITWDEAKRIIQQERNRKP